MNRLRMIGLVLAGVLAAAPAVQAQVRPHFDVNALVGLPQGAFQENVDDVGFGLSAFGGLGLGQTPVTLGLELGGMIYGYDSRDEILSPNIPEVTVDVATTNNIVMGHFVLRLQPPTGTVRPYLDGLVGFKYFFTETRIDSERDYDDRPIAASTNFDDGAASYGAGGGLDIRVYDGPLGDERHPVALSVNLGVRYLFGGEAEYLREGSIRRDGDRVTYEVERSETDLLIPQLGVRLAF